MQIEGLNHIDRSKSEQYSLVMDTILALNDLLVMFNGKAAGVIDDFEHNLERIASSIQAKHVANDSSQRSTPSTPATPAAPAAPATPAAPSTRSLDGIYNVGCVSTCEIMNIKDLNEGICYIADIERYKYEYYIVCVLYASVCFFLFEFRESNGIFANKTTVVALNVETMSGSSQFNFLQ